VKFASPQVDCNALQAFRSPATSGSFRAVANNGGISLNMLRACVGEAERLAGRRRLERSVAGVTVTADGKRLLDRVEAMVTLLRPKGTMMGSARSNLAFGRPLREVASR
jgi:DNA-binding transcriptional LysR family regulator